MSSSLCIVHHPPGHVELKECDLSEVGERQYLVESHYTAVSPGTESRCLLGKQAGVGEVDFVPGYQGAGVILEAGAKCKHKPGDPVFFGGGGGFQGGVSAFWGSHAKRLIVDEDKLYLLPKGVSEIHASICKLGAIALHGVKVGQIKTGDRVAVIGLGILGQFSSRLAQLAGAEVFGYDINANRVQIAQTAGVPSYQVNGDLPQTVSRIFGPEERYDVIVDVTGNAELINQAIGLAHDLLPWNNPLIPGTRYIVQGSYPGDFSFDYQMAFRKELNLMFPRDNTRPDVEEMLTLISEKRIEVSDLAGKPLSPVEAPSCYKDLGAADPTRLTSVFDWSMV